MHIEKYNLGKHRLTQLEYHLLSQARRLVDQRQSIEQIYAALAAELHEWRTTRQKYQHAGTTVELFNHRSVWVKNAASQMIFTVNP